MINTLMQIVAPHYCYGCGKVGSVLCHNCKYDIVCEPFSGCIVCSRPANKGVCEKCEFSYVKAWCVGEREDVLKRIIDAYKFERVAAAADTLASLLDQSLPEVPRSVIVTNIPTASSHIRQRGYDHAAGIAKRFAKLRGLNYEMFLHRNDSGDQRGLSKRDRYKQAAGTFKCNKALNSDTTYLIVDDVVTTNATLRYAAAELINAGAGAVWVAVLARQPLGKREK